MKIEHFETRAQAPERLFDWDNLLGVCLGEVATSERPGDRYHCDTYRGQLPPDEQQLAVNPATFPPDAGSLFSYTNEGEMRPAHGLDGPARDPVSLMIERLNLNTDRLKRNRAGVLARLRSELRRTKVTDARIRALLEIARTPRRGLLPPHAQVAERYLEKKLRARA